MRLTSALVPLLVLTASVPSATAQERFAGPLADSVAREAARLGTEAVPGAQDSSASPSQPTSSRRADPLPAGTRVRLTAGPVVDVPGLIRLDTSVAYQSEAKNAAAGIVSSDETAVTVQDSNRRRVTVPQPRAIIVGRVERWDGQILTVARESGPVISIPRGAIARLDRFDGTTPRSESARRAFIAGARVCGGIGGAFSLAGIGAWQWRAPVAVILATTPALLCGGVGALAAAAGGPQDRWMPIDVTSLDK